MVKPKTIPGSLGLPGSCAQLCHVYTSTIRTFGTLLPPGSSLRYPRLLPYARLPCREDYTSPSRSRRVRASLASVSCPWTSNQYLGKTSYNVEPFARLLGGTRRKIIPTNLSPLR